MSYVIKVSKPGYDVDGDNSKKIKIEKPLDKTSINNNFLSVFASIYIDGAKEQIKRYQSAFSICETNPAAGVCKCLHEFSNLSEDLNTIAYYMKKCRCNNKMHDLIKNIRNHLRHDIRDYFNVDCNQKNKRAIYLKLDPKLQESINFDLESIKVGEIVIEINQINTYLNWAKNIIQNTLKIAKDSGYINNV